MSNLGKWFIFNSMWIGFGILIICVIYSVRKRNHDNEIKFQKCKNQLLLLFSFLAMIGTFGLWILEMGKKFCWF